MDAGLGAREGNRTMGDHRQLQEDRQRLHRRDQHPQCPGQKTSGWPSKSTAPTTTHPTLGSLLATPRSGAAWAKSSAEGRGYLSLKLDDPSFSAPIFANLFQDEDTENPQPHLVAAEPDGPRTDSLPAPAHHRAGLLDTFHPKLDPHDLRSTPERGSALPIGRPSSKC